jgi:hypothetical protein
MRMPQNPIRWVLTILFLTLVGLTLWIVWAMDKLEERKTALKAKQEAEQRAGAREPAVPK